MRGYDTQLQAMIIGVASTLQKSCTQIKFLPQELGELSFLPTPGRAHKAVRA